MSMIPADVTSLGPVGQQGAQAANHDAFGAMDLNKFIELMVAEFQNQDPLNPMENGQILQQISQIREIQSNQKLNDTLESVFLGQNVSMASGMIGDWVMKLEDTDEADNMIQVVGPVERVIVEDGIPKLAVNRRLFSLKGSPKLQVLSEDVGIKMQEMMGKMQHEVEWQRDPEAPNSPVHTGRVMGISLKYGDPELARYHVIDKDTGTLAIIDRSQVIKDLTQERIIADSDTSTDDSTE